jgi:hypothetical protein
VEDEIAVGMEIQVNSKIAVEREVQLKVRWG